MKKPSKKTMKPKAKKLPPKESKKFVKALEAEKAKAAVDSEQDEDEMDAMSSQSSSAGSEAAAFADPAAAMKNDSVGSLSLRSFRHHPDIENFYRFIYENDLRFEALEIIDQLLLEKRNNKKIKLAKAKAH